MSEGLFTRLEVKTTKQNRRAAAARCLITTVREKPFIWINLGFTKRSTGEEVLLLPFLFDSCCHGDPRLAQSPSRWLPPAHVLTWRWRSCWGASWPPGRWRRGRCRRFGAARGACRCGAPERSPGAERWSRSRSPEQNTRPRLDHLWVVEQTDPRAGRSFSFKPVFCSNPASCQTPCLHTEESGDTKWCGATGPTPPSSHTSAVAFYSPNCLEQEFKPVVPSATIPPAHRGRYERTIKTPPDLTNWKRSGTLKQKETARF